MKQLPLIALILCFFFSPAFGQNKTYFGLEFSVANDIYKIHDTGNYLKSVPLVDAQGGFNIRQELSKYLFVETALILKYYWDGFGFKSIPTYGTSSSDPSWIIPVRFGSNLNLYKSRIFLVPIVGYAFGFNPQFGYGSGRGRQASSSTTITYSYTENPDVSRYFGLLQTGLGIEFKLFKTLLGSISTNYYSGFTKTMQLDITYKVNNGNETSGTAVSKGTFWCISTGVRYPISNFWTKK